MDHILVSLTYLMEKYYLYKFKINKLGVVARDKWYLCLLNTGESLNIFLNFHSS